MERDPIREKIFQLLWQRGMNMHEAAVAIGRNPSYMHQFLKRGIPKVLSYQDAEKLSELLGCKAEELHHAERPPRQRRTGAKKPRRPEMDPGPVPLSPVSEVDVEASAGPGAIAGEFVTEKARWFLPEGMIRDEAHASPGSLRILLVKGDSMEPEMGAGDRLMVDLSKRTLVTGEMFVLWDGIGLVVKRVQPLPGNGDGPARVRLVSANPDYEPYTCLADDVHVVGKVVWVVKQV